MSEQQGNPKSNDDAAMDQPLNFDEWIKKYGSLSSKRNSYPIRFGYYCDREDKAKQLCQYWTEQHPEWTVNKVHRISDKKFEFTGITTPIVWSIDTIRVLRSQMDVIGREYVCYLNDWSPVT